MGKFNNTITRLVKNDSKRIIKCPVYVPLEEDTQGDFMTSEEIEKMAYGFMKKMNLHNVDKQHDFDPDEGYVCESYLAQKDDPDGFVEGSWIVAIKVEKEETWEQVENEEITGLSLAGFARSVEEHEIIPDVGGED
jgi:hypothetical protein